MAENQIALQDNTEIEEALKIMAPVAKLAGVTTDELTALLTMLHAGPTCKEVQEAFVNTLVSERLSVLSKEPKKL